MKPALLVIDVQNEWLSMSPGLKASLEQRLEVINAAIDLFRQKGLPIVRIYHVSKGVGPEPGTERFAFHPMVKISETDAQIIKNYPNAFNKTDLGEILAKEEVGVIVLCGLSATGCVMATFIGAVDRDLQPFLLKDGIADSREENVRFIEELFDHIGVSALNHFL